MDARSKRARAWIEALPDDAWLTGNRDRLLSYWSDGLTAIARNGGTPSLEGMEGYAASLGRAIAGGEELVLGEAIAAGRTFFQLDDDEMAPFLRRCIRSMVEAGARPATLAPAPASGLSAAIFIRLATEASTGDAVANAILARKLEDEAGSTTHIFARPERFPLGWSELAPPADIHPRRAADTVPEAREWVNERAAVAMADDVSLQSLVQAGRSRFGLTGGALEEFVADCIRAMLNAGAVPLTPAGGAQVSMQPVAMDGGTEMTVARALSLLRERGEDPSLAVDLCFGAPGGDGMGAETRRPGSETVLTTPAAFETLVAGLATTAALDEAPAGYPGGWFHSPDGSITGYVTGSPLGSLLEVLRPSRNGQPAHLPLVIQAPRQDSCGGLVWSDDAARRNETGERPPPLDETVTGGMRTPYSASSS